MRWLLLKVFYVAVFALVFLALVWIALDPFEWLGFDEEIRLIALGVSMGTGVGLWFDHLMRWFDKRIDEE